MSASPAAIPVLELGKLIDKLSDQAKLAAAEQLALDALYSENSRVIRDALQYDNNGRNIESLPLRILALIAYQQLCSNRLVMGVSDVACTIAGDNVQSILEARQAIGNLLFHRQLHIADNCGNVRLSENLLPFFGGGKPDAPVIPTQQALDRAWARAEEKSKAKKAKPGQIPTARELAARIATEVVGLEAQVRLMACRVVMHMQRAAMIKAGNDPGSGAGNETLVCLGPSGAGKTFLATCAGKASRLPSCVVCATDMTASGYVGLDVDEVLKGLVTSAGGDVNVARFGIGTVDEIDKVRSSGWEHGSKDVNGASVQAGLLRLVEGAQCVCGGRRSTDDYAVRFNTVGTMFVLCGAFVEIGRAHV